MLPPLGRGRHPRPARSLGTPGLRQPRDLAHPASDRRGARHAARRVATGRGRRARVRRRRVLDGRPATAPASGPVHRAHLRVRLLGGRGGSHPRLRGRHREVAPGPWTRAPRAVPGGHDGTDDTVPGRTAPWIEEEHSHEPRHPCIARRGRSARLHDRTGSHDSTERSQAGEHEPATCACGRAGRHPRGRPGTVRLVRPRGRYRARTAAVVGVVGPVANPLRPPTMEARRSAHVCYRPSPRSCPRAGRSRATRTSSGSRHPATGSRIEVSKPIISAIDPSSGKRVAPPHDYRAWLRRPPVGRRHADRVGDRWTGSGRMR